ncbi:MAG: hypothetical protein Q9210_004964 [Variospora velana]
MRELATRKLSDAYHRDEIAASVAAMQSASSVDDVAKLVLQRNRSDTDAKYVHFFHEKIPSRMFAESTSLDVLDDIIRSKPADVALLRTRAVTKVFKDDLTGAAADLTRALAINRSTATQRIAPRIQTGFLTGLGSAQKGGSSPSCNLHIKAGDEDRPSSLESQLLFQRAGIYLALACQNIATHFDRLKSSGDLPAVSDSTRSNLQNHENSFSNHVHSYSLEATKLTKSYAKRALRDYTSFLGFFEYTTGCPKPAAEKNEADSAKNMSGLEHPGVSSGGEALESVNEGAQDEAALAEALMPYQTEVASSQNAHAMFGYRCSPVSLRIFPLSDLFAAVPPSDLPTDPAASGQIVTISLQRGRDSSGSSLSAPINHEAVTFHPLLIESLHAILLCHSLLQTSPTEHLRHAHMVARLTRLCDGYPIFLTATSPSRSDWVEILRRGNNWIGLKHPWDTLCAHVPSTQESTADQREEIQEQARERITQKAIMDSLADERVHDGATFQAAVASRERQAEALGEDVDFVGRNQNVSTYLNQGDRNDFPICSERAETIAKWVNEAPRSITWSGRSKRCGKVEKMRTEVMCSAAEAPT